MSQQNKTKKNSKRSNVENPNSQEQLTNKVSQPKKQITVIKRSERQSVVLNQCENQALINRDLRREHVGDIQVPLEENNNHNLIIEEVPFSNPVLKNIERSQKPEKKNPFDRPVRVFNLGPAKSEQKDLVNAHGCAVQDIKIKKPTIGKSNFATRGNKTKALIAQNCAAYIQSSPQSQVPLVSMEIDPPPPDLEDEDDWMKNIPPPPPPDFLFASLYGGTESFTYKKKFFRKIFGIKMFYYVRKQYGYLPKRLVERLWKLTLFTNSLNYAHYRSILGSDKDIVNLVNHWRLFHYSSRDNFLLHLDAFYFHTCGLKSKHSERIAHPNSKHALNQKNSRAYLNKLTPIEPWYSQLFKNWLIKDWVIPFLKTVTYASCIFFGTYYGARKLLPKIQKHQLIPFFPKFSLYLEEIIKIFPGGASLVSWLERHLYGNNRNAAWHKKSTQWSFWTRVENHKRVNRDSSYFVDVCTSSILYQSQQEQYYYSNRYTEASDSMIERWCDDVIIPAVTVPKPKNPLTGYPKNPQLHLYNTNDNYNKFPVEETHLGIYPLCFHLGDFVQPANSTDNLFCAWDLRVSSWDNSVVDEDKKPLFQQHLKQVIWMEPKYNPEWFLNLRAQQKTNLIQTEDDITSGILCASISFSVKCDEILPCHEKMVPRIIAHCHKEPFYRMGEHTHAFTKAWAESHNHTLNGIVTRHYNDYGDGFGITYKIAIYYTCGATSAELSQAVNSFLQSPGLHVLLMVMGDDTFAIIRHSKHHVTYFMCDFSRMDRTNSSFLRDSVNDEIALIFEPLALERKSMYSKPWSFVRTKSIKGRVQPDHKSTKIDMLLTGEPGTSVINSIVNATVGVDVLTSYLHCNMEQFEGMYAMYGFVARGAKVVNNVSECDYLKGVFLETTDDDIHWIRLPSFLCKFGKVLTRPKNILKEPNSDKLIRLLIRAQWAGYGDMRTNWFYCSIHDLISKYCGDVIPDTDHFKLGDWQITQSHVYVPDHVWDQFMINRYGIYDFDMTGFLHLFEELLKGEMPCVYFSDLITTLGRRDY